MTSCGTGACSIQTVFVSEPTCGHPPCFVSLVSQAEAFAALVLMDFVSIAGATQTIVTLLKKPDNRCAAITMLGKTIELCSDQVRVMSGSRLHLDVGQGDGSG